MSFALGAAFVVTGCGVMMAMAGAAVADAVDCWLQSKAVVAVVAVVDEGVFSQQFKHEAVATKCC